MVKAFALKCRLSKGAGFLPSVWQPKGLATPVIYDILAASMGALSFITTRSHWHFAWLWCPAATLSFEGGKKEHQPRAENGGDNLMLTLRLSLIVATSITKIYRNIVCVFSYHTYMYMYMYVYTYLYMQNALCKHLYVPMPSGLSEKSCFGWDLVRF